MLMAKAIKSYSSSKPISDKPEGYATQESRLRVLLDSLRPSLAPVPVTTAVRKAGHRE